MKNHIPLAITGTCSGCNADGAIAYALNRAGDDVEHKCHTCAAEVHRYNNAEDSLRLHLSLALASWQAHWVAQGLLESEVTVIIQQAAEDLEREHSQLLALPVSPDEQAAREARYAKQGN